MATVPVFLIAVDGSDQSMNTVAYLGGVLSAKNVAIELFHVLAEAPEPFFDLAETKETATFRKEISEWKISRSSQIHQFMENAKKTLVINGFSSDSISATIQS